MKSKLKPKQKAIITLKDTSSSKMKVKVTYDPCVPGGPPVTSASVRASLGILKFLAEHR